MKKLYQKSLLVFCLTVGLTSLVVPLCAQPNVAYVLGFRVFHDSIPNCIADSFEQEIHGVRVTLEILPSGLFATGFSGTGIGLVVYSGPGDTLVRVYTSGTSNLGLGCTNIFEFPVAVNDTSLSIDFPIQAGQCPQIGVDISGSPPRPCFDKVYYLRAFNQGLDAAQNVYADVKLDPNLLFQSSSISGTPLGNNTWRFQLGNIPALGVKLFNITYQLNCDVPLGQVICSEAIVFPDTVCVPNGGWSGASVLADVVCDGDSVVFTLANNTIIPTTSNLGYIIAEDLIMYRQDMFNINPMDSIRIAVPANGSTWHVSAEQEPGYPYQTYTNATLEGCGTNQSGGVSTGVFLNYPFSSGQANRGEDCQEAIGSFDPNDKMAFPAGFGPNHLIRVGDEIKFQVRFQNTGTDTAYSVVVREQLPQGLDPGSVVAGVASHPYGFGIDQNGAMTFIFSNINLPDSLHNPLGSNGFLTYKARPLADLPDGSVISGAANIYFDFNPPIITNTVFHTIGEDFIKVEVNNVSKLDMKLAVFPNPGTDIIHFSWDNKLGQAWEIKLFDVLGKCVKTINSTDKIVMLPCRDLLSGLYYFQVNVENRAAANGKIILK